MIECKPMSRFSFFAFFFGFFFYPSPLADGTG